MFALPNALTILRIVLVPVFAVAFVMPGDAARLVAFGVFVIAGVSDWLDGFAARKLKAGSDFGRMLDPIADKVLVAAAIVGLVAVGQVGVALPGGLILFREFSVSALRETLAPKGLRLPVTVLAKWKTTLQLIALAALMFMGAWSWWGVPCAPETQATAGRIALGLLWLAAAVTVWTGAEYALAARKALHG